MFAYLPLVCLLDGRLLPLDSDDHTLVRLQSGADADITQCGDYINASAIYDSDPRSPVYIVAQAPMDATAPNFWQMVWEQGSVVIVNLTKLAENGDAKCHRYWPENGSEVHGIFEVEDGWRSVTVYRCAGPLGVGAHLVRGLPGAVVLSEELADERDTHGDAVPLPELAGRQGAGEHQTTAGVP